MATMDVETNQPFPAASNGHVCLQAAKARGGGGGEGLRQCYLRHIHDLQLQVRQRMHNLNRLEPSGTFSTPARPASTPSNVRQPSTSASFALDPCRLWPLPPPPSAAS